MSNPSVRVRMTSPVVTTSPTHSLADLAKLLLARNISAVPIVDDETLPEPLGLVSTTDLLADLARGHGQFVAKTAGEIMQSPLLTVDPEVSVNRAAGILAREHVHRLVVVEDHRVVGIVAAGDLVADVKAQGVVTPLSSLMMRAISTVDIGTPIDEAVVLLGLSHVHGVVVVDGSRPVGVLTHREALRSRELLAPLRTQPVEEIMSYETICLDADTPASRAAAYATAMNVRRILVVRGGHLLGIVSALDLVGTLARGAT